MNKRLWTLTLQICIVMVCAAGSAQAQGVSTADTTDKWDQSFTLYGWLAGQNGDIAVGGTQADVDVSISDALDALSSLDGAFLGHYEDKNGRSTIIADLFYIKLTDTAQTGLGPFSYESSQTVAELAGAYRIGDLNPERSVELLGGFRYTSLDLSLTGPTGNTVGGDQGWVDLFVGGRYKKLLSEKWRFSIRGDIGGFGIGDSSDFVWNLVPVFQYGLSERTSLELGWRWLDYDYDTGSGADEFKYNILMQGPLIGFTYMF